MGQRRNSYKALKRSEKNHGSNKQEIKSEFLLHFLFGSTGNDDEKNMKCSWQTMQDCLEVG